MAPRDKSRARGWVFTLNNYTAEDEARTKAIKERHNAKYLTYGREVGEGTGTPHLQGFIYFNSARTGRQVRNMFKSKVWTEPQMGPLDKAIAYCQKDGDFTELGERPKTPQEAGTKGGLMEKNRWSSILQLAQRGDFTTLQELFPHEWLQYRPRLVTEYKPERKPMGGELPHEWWVGPTGAGKSRLAWELYPSHYAKTTNKWWDNYQFEDVVIIEEWSPKNECTASCLKKWADRYPFPCEVKGAMVPNIRPRKIIVLSNYTIEQCFPNKEDCDPLLRRFKVIQFPIGKAWARARVNNFEPSKSPKEEIANSGNIAQLFEQSDADIDSIMADIDMTSLEEEGGIVPDHDPFDWTPAQAWHHSYNPPN